ncbi:MAG TPA: hypothetical protein P5217_06525 [Methanoregulaceae archaeon]|nr:hypothetical protein [Methanoregulaceae archaeon]HPD76332.1 hypothetical protein [Methanoregulaceae archaeon]HRY75920.1 hypothetical protein [Methanoregulaceae archaeon]
MTEEGLVILVVGAVAVIVACLFCATFVALQRQQRRLADEKYKLKVYSDLLHAVTELNLAGDDGYKLDRAKKNLAFTVNRLNLVASPGVLRCTSDLLDFLNEHLGKDFDALRLHNVLNALVIEARRDLNTSHAKSVEEAQVRFRFFAPPRK